MGNSTEIEDDKWILNNSDHFLGKNIKPETYFKGLIQFEQINQCNRETWEASKHYKATEAEKVSWTKFFNDFSQNEILDLTKVNYKPNAQIVTWKIRDYLSNPTELPPHCN